MREILRDYLDPFFNILNYRIFTLGEAQITPLNILYLLVLTVLLFWLSNRLRNFFVERVLGRTHLDLGARVAIGTIARYLVLLIGFLIIIQSVGIDLTTLNVLAGAIGIGVGFGLQNVASNFISGLIILFERPVKVGDRIEVDDADGKVVSIGARSTVVRTNDNVTIIVPNSKFISENVINWSYANQSVRFRIPVGVAYDSDLHLVKKLLLEAAEENSDVLTDPKPAVRLVEFGDNSINLQLWIWTREKLQRKTVLTSQLNFAIWEKFRAHDIEIPFPQTDLHIRSDASKNNGKNGSNGAQSKTAASEHEPDDFNELVETETETENANR